jgi:hypothetical protein
MSYNEIIFLENLPIAWYNARQNLLVLLQSAHVCDYDEIN